MVACYRCGAYPNHPSKTLDVLKLIRCEDCGKIACVKHREGALGSKCSCGSSRSSIAALRKGGSGPSGEAGNYGGGGGSVGGASSAATGTVSIGSGQLQEMQKSRQEAAAEGQARLAAQQQAVAEEKLTAEERARREKTEEELKGLFGDSNYVQVGVAEEFRPKEEKKVSDLKSSTTILASAVQQASISDQMKDLMSSDNFNDGSGGLELGSSSSLAGVSAQSAVSVDKIGDQGDLNPDAEKAAVGNAQVHKIVLLDSFNVKSNYRIKLDEVIKIKNQASEDIKSFIAQEFHIDENKLDLTLKVNNFIPLDYIDHLLNLHAEDLEKEHINIITGVLAQKLTFDTVSYADQFRHILPQKTYIKGIYVSFANNPEYDYAEQKALNLDLIDMAQENDKIVYLGLDNSPISHWQEIFDEYDLTEIPFVYTEVIKTPEELEFIKKNNIKILIRPDVDFNYYANIIEEYKNFCFGSSFERIVDGPEDQQKANSAILSQILQNMYNINQEFIENLLNLED